MTKKNQNFPDPEDLDEETYQEVLKERERRDRWGFFYWPYEWLLDELEDRFLEENDEPNREMEFYADWEHEELVPRMLFLQDCAMGLYVELMLWKRFIWPISLFLAAAVGLYLGTRLH